MTTERAARRGGVAEQSALGTSYPRCPPGARGLVRRGEEGRPVSPPGPQSRPDHADLRIQANAGRLHQILERDLARAVTGPTDFLHLQKLVAVLLVGLPLRRGIIAQR